MNKRALNAITKMRWHLEKALYTIRAHRLRKLRAQAYAGKIPIDAYVTEYMEFWQQYERSDDE